MYDLLVIGGLGVDVRVRVPGMPLPVVDSVTVEPIDLRVGNTGAGVVLAAHAIGLRVAVVDTVGADPPGDVVRTALARAGVPAVLADDPAGTRRSVNLVDPDGRRMSLYDPRPSVGPPPFTATRLAALAGDTSHVHLSIMGWVRDLLPDLGDVLGEGVGTSTDLHDWDGRNPYHRPFAEVAELVLVSGTALGHRADQLAAALAPRPVLVTRGADGADLYLGGTLSRVPAATPPGPVIDTNGAGDAFTAGMVAARSRGATWAEAAGYATRVAAAACTHDGMEYPPGLLPRD
ncbi:Sugar or nucleoside kinase, ribokinase family [Micromonospora phaseoli]|uniref:Sugar or nucleoside kinase, ribokinase family n=1 Tax=Micromonospora phaseoli TaxID=1144548 RepID=A0A1H7CB91_9ACTN|nr:carbohydrate kinase family protein [Micromonospora phaseoli]PZV97943.1 sugar/nucleoside kinase (ribokinase family) [Micromonospora phaseoli]GIJ78609.1 fructoselysine 6-kinase [Micromonospora phaseoli]SEJ86999.1 Sugar or nucleoside kinase, ribokinase family [Micromonospora phaseoli]